MIRVNDNYLIDVKILEYEAVYDTGKTTVDKKTGDILPIHVTVGHYSTIEGAIKGILKDMQRRKLSEKDMNLVEAIKEINAINYEFETLLEKALKA